MPGERGAVQHNSSSIFPGPRRAASLATVTGVRRDVPVGPPHGQSPRLRPGKPASLAPPGRPVGMNQGNSGLNSSCQCSIQVFQVYSLIMMLAVTVIFCAPGPTASVGPVPVGLATAPVGPWARPGPAKDDRLISNTQARCYSIAGRVFHGIS